MADPFVLFFYDFFHAVAFAFDDHRFCMVKEAVEECGGEGAIVVEDFSPVFEHAVGGDDEGALFVAGADDLEQQIGAGFVNGQIA